MEVFLMVRYKKTTMFLNAKEDTTVEELKKIIEGIMKVSPEDQQLYKDHEIMNPSKLLQDYGLKSSTAVAHNPALVGLTFRDKDTHEFEVVHIVPFSEPPDLLDLPQLTEESKDGSQ